MQRQRIQLAALAIAGLLALLACVLILPRLLYPPLSRAELQGVPTTERRIELQQAQMQLQNNARALLLQGLGGLFLVAGVIATWQQVLISREGQITERFTRAIDQLGSDKVDVRVGGIHALERIAKNSKSDQPTITRILCAFVRTHTPWPAGSPDSPEPHPTPVVDARLPWLRDRAPDVHAAVNVLVHRPAAPGEQELHLPLVDLRRTYLAEAKLSRATFRFANLARAYMRQVHLEHGDLQEADLRQAHLNGGRLSRSNFSRAYLDQACLRGAHLQQAILTNAHLREADLQDADLRQASLCGADLRGANLHGARLEGADLSSAMEDSSTIWPEGFDTDRRRAAGVTTEAQAPPRLGLLADDA